MLGKWREPSRWIGYNFRSYYSTFTFYHQKANPGKIVKLHLTIPVKLRIDPRSHFTGLRCAAIMCIDRIAAWWTTSQRVQDAGVVTHYVGPKVRQLINLCEMLANYP